MHSLVSWILMVLLAAASLVLAEAEMVDLSIKDQSFFTDRTAVAVAVFDEVIEQANELPEDTADCHFLEIEVNETPGVGSGKSAAVVHFLPKRTGLVTVPSLRFLVGEKIYQTRPARILVGEPQLSDKMKISVSPAKSRVYAGEPLRLDLVWDCGLPAAALRDLQWQPAFFSDPDVEVVVPRNTGAEGFRVGLPIGGRRVEATRTTKGVGERKLGHIGLTVYLRFNKPGKQVIPEMRLDCALLAEDSGNFATYASYFNNGLFEPVEEGKIYQRVYVTAPAMEIEVLPLPEENRRADFSGLFEPLKIDVSVKPAVVVVGQLMEVEIKLSGDAPHGMLELPPLRNQNGLRGRFLIDDAYGRLWHENGTLFQTRLRALTISVQALPSFRFQVFDPATGSYRMRVTDAIPLVVKPGGGQDFVALKSFEGALSKLSDQPEGIWQNLRVNPMNDFLNQLIVLVQRVFLWLLLAGPLAFFVLLPWARERRRRALDAGYRSRALAFAELRKMPADSLEKWPAFLRFLAASFGAAEKTWTIGDSQRALRSIGLSENEIAQISALHAAADAQDFSTTRRDAKFAGLDALAKRVMQLLARCALMWLAVILFPVTARADEWLEAQTAFERALASPAGGESAQAAYEESALKFEVAALAGRHVGEAWSNAGNAWFQAGAIGRSIAAYRRARDFRPMDDRLAKSLAAARALVATDVPVKQPIWKQIPALWLRPLLVAVNLAFWLVLLLALRFRGRPWFIAAGVSGLLLVMGFVLYFTEIVSARPAGVVIVDAVDARKGPSYSYAKAFVESLRDGLEFTVMERRGTWKRIRLADGRECWVSESQVEEI